MLPTNHLHTGARVSLPEAVRNSTPSTRQIFFTTSKPPFGMRC